MLFTDYCSRITVHGYCWPQYKNCIVTHFQQPLVVLQYNFSLSPPIAIHFLMVQYNLAPSSKSQYNIVYCNTLTQPHQSCNTMPWPAIQLPCNTISLSQYNLLPKTRSQYNGVLQYTHQSFKLFSCNTKPRL